MKQLNSPLSFFFKSLMERVNKKLFFIIVLLSVFASCTKDNVTPTPPTPTPPVVIIPPAETGKVTITTGTPTVIGNNSVSFTNTVAIVAPATVTSTSMLISWYVDTLQVAQSETVNGLSFTKTNCIPGTKYTVKALANASTGTVSGDQTFGTTTGFHIGQTFNGFKIWDVWSNGDSARQIGNLLAEPYAWGCGGVDVPGTTSDYNAGMANSLKIKAICPASAANLCLNDAALGAGSYLGSQNEWIRFFQNMVKANITTSFSGVWSSTQENYFYAMIVRDDGFSNRNAKMSNAYPVFAGPAVFAFKRIGK